MIDKMLAGVTKGKTKSQTAKSRHGRGVLTDSLANIKMIQKEWYE